MVGRIDWSRLASEVVTTSVSLNQNGLRRNSTGGIPSRGCLKSIHSLAVREDANVGTNVSAKMLEYAEATARRLVHGC